MGKVIKIQSNIKLSPSYNVDNIEAVYAGGMYQEVKYNVLDEYNIPYGSYVTLRNYDDIYFDEATLQTVKSINNEDVEQTYIILQSDEEPNCEIMYNLYNQYCNNNDSYKGVVLISKSEVVYNEIVVTAEEVSNNGDFRITNIYLDGEYPSVSDALQRLQTNNPVVFDFDDVYPKCAKYWKKKQNNTKTSCFDETKDDTLQSLLSFEEGFGTYYQDPTTQEEYNQEYWNKFQNIGTGLTYAMPDGQYYISEEVTSGSGGGEQTDELQVKDSDYNIFDVLYRYIYDYICSQNDVLYAEAGSNDGGSAGGSSTPYIGDGYKMVDPANYTFLLKTYKMYVKAPQADINASSGSSQEDNGSNDGTENFPRRITRNGSNTYIPTSYFDATSGGMSASDITSYSTKVLTSDEIKDLTADEAQEYFDNTLVHNVQAYKDKLILSKSEAKEVLLSLNITECNKYFVISSNVGIQMPSSQQYEYFDLGNFELKRETVDSFNRSTINEYKYNTNGKVVRIRQIYDPYENEFLTITHENSGEFSEGYNIERKGVSVRCISGKTDYYFFENTDSGEELAEQLKEDILYAMEDGPSIVSVQNLVNIDSN